MVKRNRSGLGADSQVVAVDPNWVPKEVGTPPPLSFHSFSPPLSLSRSLSLAPSLSDSFGADSQVVAIDPNWVPKEVNPTPENVRPLKPKPERLGARISR